MFGDGALSISMQQFVCKMLVNLLIASNARKLTSHFNVASKQAFFVEKFSRV